MAAPLAELLDTISVSVDPASKINGQQQQCKQFLDNLELVQYDVAQRLPTYGASFIKEEKMDASLFSRSMYAIKRYPGEIGLRILAIIASLTFFYYFPMLVFITYMGHKGFFSYDMFSTGRVGLESFYFACEIIIIITAIYTAGFLILLVRRFTFLNPDLSPSYKTAPIHERKHGLWLLVTVSFNILLSIFFCYGVIRSSWISSHPSRFDSQKFAESFRLLVGVFGICTWVAIHIGVVIYQNAKRVFGSLCFGIFALVSVSLLMPETISRILDSSLAYFGVGGDLPISISYDEAGTAKGFLGKLVLLTPSQIFVSKNSHIFTIFERSKVTSITISNESAFHK
ncbi:hypothetical protein JOE11_005486 [Robbsia andropogonis]|uniref:hypothetical protein n=1 Tax=Robbsia andropogonis TaxID=28092 RepID=UPI003D1C4579